MLTLERTIDIPASREVRFVAPKNVPTGIVSIRVVFQPLDAPESEAPPAKPPYTPKPFPTLEELKAESHRKYQERFKEGRDAFEELYGCMPGAYYGDGVKFQRELRDEWPD
ncbi:MAG: hypothetical protein LBR16_05285 [Treponema sp.]|jgi:hypothetical protein|nr:hypothetical protein [Treponema sp.]